MASSPVPPFSVKASPGRPAKSADSTLPGTRDGTSPAASGDADAALQSAAAMSPAGPPVRKPSRKLPVLILIVACIVAVRWFYPPDGGSPVPATGSTAATTDSATLTPGTSAHTPDPRLRDPDPALASLSDADRTRMLLGVWKTHHYGTQQIDNRADGTASLDIEYDFLASLLYGRRMQLELTWKIERGVLTNIIATGTPTDKVNRLIADFGNTCRYRMLELSTNRLLLQEIDDPDTFHVWTRVESP